MGGELRRHRISDGQTGGMPLELGPAARQYSLEPPNIRWNQCIVYSVGLVVSPQSEKRRWRSVMPSIRIGPPFGDFCGRSS